MPRRDGDQQLPHNLGAERALLGSIFLRNDVIFDVSDIVTKADFFEPFNGELFILLKDQIEAGRKSTPMTILHDVAQDADIGGVRASKYLADLYDQGVHRDQAIEIARGIRDNALRRRIIATAEQFIIEAHSAPVSTSADVIRGRFTEAFDALFPSLTDLGVVGLAEYGDMALARAQRAFKGGAELGLNWPLAAAQDLIGALLPGRLTALAGASGSGKSLLAQQLLEHVCRPNPDDQKWGLLVQAEMEGEEVAVRGLASETGVRGYAIERATVSDAEFESIWKANERLRGTGVLVDASTFPSVKRIRSTAIRLKGKGRLHLIVVDHLQYLDRPDGSISDIEAIMPNMRGLKMLAKELHIPILVLMPLKSSYSDALASGIVRRPHLGDVNHPAAIDVNSDAIMFVHRPEYILRRNQPAAEDKKHADWLVQIDTWAGRAELIKAKQRNDDGGSWSKKLWFGDGKRAKFYDHEPPRYFPGDEGDDRLPL